MPAIAEPSAASAAWSFFNRSLGLRAKPPCNEHIARCLHNWGAWTNPPSLSTIYGFWQSSGTDGGQSATPQQPGCRYDDTARYARRKRCTARFLATRQKKPDRKFVGCPLRPQPGSVKMRQERIREAEDCWLSQGDPRQRLPADHPQRSHRHSNNQAILLSKQAATRSCRSACRRALSRSGTRARPSRSFGAA